MNDLSNVEDRLHLIFLLYNLDFVDGKVVGEIGRQSVQKYEEIEEILDTEM